MTASKALVHMTTSGAALDTIAGMYRNESCISRGGAVDFPNDTNLLWPAIGPEIIPENNTYREVSMVYQE